MSQKQIRKQRGPLVNEGPYLDFNMVVSKLYMFLQVRQLIWAADISKVSVIQSQSLQFAYPSTARGVFVLFLKTRSAERPKYEQIQGIASGPFNPCWSARGWWYLSVSGSGPSASLFTLEAELHPISFFLETADHTDEIPWKRTQTRVGKESS